MNRIIQFIIFFSIFIAIYSGLNYYVLYRLTGFFNIQRNLWFYVAFAAATFSYMLTAAMEKNFPTLLTRMLHMITSTWMGVLFFFFLTLILYEIARHFIRLSPQTFGIIVLCIVGALTVFSIVNALFITVNRIELPIEGLDEELTIAQISDVHFGSLRNSGLLKDITKKINAADPDVVVITGDLIDGTAPLKDGMFHELDSINAPMFFVTGNHETYEGLDKVMEILKTTKIVPLRNKLERFKGIQIIGVDYNESNGRLNTVLKDIKINQSVPAILLFHNPSQTDAAKKYGIDLQLSGHTHSGQVWPFNYLVRLQFKYLNGLYDLGGIKLYVSPGTGTWGPPMRLGSRNEITVLRLVPA